ncbi:MAG: aminotransferase [Cytophagales bacterium CG12_big_fil_rev_8_21_14_0_65_40_12]|nr:MAG: aminotransferase [Cytophagales bacterium CG12_big_fil_rev_8_21_14_0_65_40_12]PIW05661.1 MAG: aminotransferase [Cytophagales bacterium CG17_big_fil_post_rev_8_21_14_2_50_40_13]
MLTDQDIQRFRLETRGTQHVIHFNNAGSSLPPDAVRNAVNEYNNEEMTMGGYETNQKYLPQLEATYDSIAKLLNANRDEIALVENATVAWNAAFQAIDWENGDVIIATRADYASNYLAYLHLKRKFDLEIKVIPSLTSGDLDLQAFEKMIDSKVKLVSVTHMPTNGGLTVDAEAVGVITKKHGVLYLLDACQSAGQYPIDVEKIGCDMLSATGRKYLRAPRGTGFLYVRRSVLSQLTPYCIDSHAAEWTGVDSYQIRTDARKFEGWEASRANTMGLKAAIDYALTIGVENIWQRIQYLAAILRNELAQLPYVKVHDIGDLKSGLVSFTLEGKSADEAKTYLHERGINVSWNGTSNTYLDMTSRDLKEVVRASVHYYNNEEEISDLITVLKKIN